MQRRPRALTAALLVALLGLGAAALGLGGGDEAAARIIGGTPVQQGELRSVVFIEYLVPNGKHEIVACTGTVIAPRFVLTAAHCVWPENVRFDVANLRVIVGDVKVTGPDRRVLGVTRAIQHPDWDLYSGRNDLALLELATPARVPAMPLASRRFWSPGEEATIAGWGKTDRQQKTLTYVMHRARTTVRGYPECRRDEVAAGQICARDAIADKSSNCFGDSGGPLLVRRASDHRLVEIGVLFGGSYCNPDELTIFNSVVAGHRWVTRSLREAGETLPTG
jgi:secreted trypsin-like serine protease